MLHKTVSVAILVMYVRAVIPVIHVIVVNHALLLRIALHVMYVIRASLAYLVKNVIPVRFAIRFRTVLPVILVMHVNCV